MNARSNKVRVERHVDFATVLNLMSKLKFDPDLGNKIRSLKAPVKIKSSPLR